MLIGAILLLFTSTVAVFVTLVVLLAHTVKRWVKVSFAASLVGLTLWQVTIFIADQAHTNLLFWNHLVFVWPTLALISFYAFVSFLRPTVPIKSIKPKDKKDYWVASILLLSVLLQVVSIASGRIFNDVTLGPATADYEFARGPAYPFYVAGVILLLSLVLPRVLINFIASKKLPQERRAFRIILTTVAIAAAYGVITNIVLPVLTGSQKYINLGLITVDIVAIGFALSIIRYQFLDIRAYVFRAVVYIVSLLSLAVAYVVVAGLLSIYLLDISLSIGAIVVLSMVTLAVAVSFQPLRVRFNRLTNRLFFREYYDPQQVLDMLGDLLIKTVDPAAIKEGSKALLENAMRATSVRFVLTATPNDDEGNLKLLTKTDLDLVVPGELDRNRYSTLIQELRKDDVALAVRLRTKHEDLGYMLLGYRQSGIGYSSGDRRFLVLVADQLAIGLQNALRFQEIEKFNITLQQKVEDATRKLRRTNEKLRLMDQTKDDFISMASHQLRTPLTSVKGYVSMVLDGDVGKINPLQHKLLNQSFISSQRMSYLISDLLNVSRLRTGKFVIEPVPCNLAKMVQDEIEQLVETAKGRGLELTYHKPEHFPTYMLDETKLRQVVMNFIDNAIYYTPSGGHITVILEERPLSIELRVVDDGIGVSKHEQHHLFTKFFRAHNAKRARPDGTGLGLFMAKKVIVAQGGSIIFESQEDKGSTFGFTFAKSKLQAPPAKPATSKPKADQGK